MKTILYYSILIALIVSPSFLSAQNDFDKFLNSIDSSYNDFSDSTNKTFTSFVKRNEEAFNKFKQEIEKIWGSNEFRISDSINWIEYYDQKKARSIVDFKKNEATIEMLVPADSINNQAVINKKAEALVKSMVVNKGKTIDYDTPEEEPADLSEVPVLQNQLITTSGETVNNSNIDDYSKEIVQKTEIKTKEVVGTDGITRIKYTLTIPLAPNSIKVRAAKVLPIVQKYSQNKNLEPELVLAIIHIESYFNPKAVSHANAIGLMQLVASSGGLEAYRKVFKEDKKPTFRFLLNPENNINMGTTYVRILMDRYFSKIENETTKRYCCIASYNTGPGNLSYAYIQSKKLSNAISTINLYSPQENYDYLIENLVYEEARNYLKKVNEKYWLYKKWIAEKK